MFDVVTIGSATRDVFVEGRFPTIPWKTTPSGRAYALPRGEKLSVSKMFFTLGGNAANAAVTFAKQEFKTACITRVGDDAGGHEAAEHLRKNSVETKFITYDKTNPTSYSILILEKGERTILNYQGASSISSLDHVPLAKLKAKWWYLSSPGKSASMFPDVMRHAARENIQVGFNPTEYHLKHKLKDIIRALPSLAFLVVNDEEAAILTGIPFRKHEEIMNRMSRAMPRGIFAMTLGPRGVMVAHGGLLYHAGIFKEKKIEDRTGAGDSWGSGFVAGLMHQQDLGSRVKGLGNMFGFGRSSKVPFSEDNIRYAIRLASANATANVEVIGATEGTLTRAQFDRDPRWKKLPIKITKIGG